MLLQLDRVTGNWKGSFGVDGLGTGGGHRADHVLQASEAVYDYLLHHDALQRTTPVLQLLGV